VDHKNLIIAKREKNDEFYTRYYDVEKEVGAYLDYDPNTFRDKTVYCNCDDPYESNFFKYFVLNFRKLGLKRLITTSYDSSPIANTELVLSPGDESKAGANKFVINEVGDFDNKGEFNLKSVATQLQANRNNEWSALKGNGDFRSPECVELLMQSDIVVTNPPFSLFREFVKQLFDYDKKFLIIGNLNAVTYKEVFPLIKGNRMWLGVNNEAKIFQIPEYYIQTSTFKGQDEKKYAKVSTAVWFTNLEHGRHHKPLQLMTMADNLRYSRHKDIKEKGYQKYDNYNAIEVSHTNAIPSDYTGVMGVPISFLYKYCPEQFEIIGMAEDNGKGFSGGIWDGKNPHCVINGQNKFKRIFIKGKEKNENSTENLHG